MPLPVGSDTCAAAAGSTCCMREPPDAQPRLAAVCCWLSCLPHMCFVGRWSDEPDTVLLHHLPHKPLTAPVKLGDFDFCAPAGTPYPKEMQVCDP